MRNILIAIVALFTFAGAQAAEPRANKGKVNKIIKAIKELDGKHVSVKEYDADSVVGDIKKQLYEQFDEKKVDKVWQENKITLSKSILVESQDEEGYNNMRTFAAKLNIEKCENLAGIPQTAYNNNDSVGIAFFSDKNNTLVFSDSLLSRKYTIVYADDDIAGKSQSMLQQLVNDELESITSGGLITKFTDSKGKPVVFGAADDEGEAPGTDFQRFIRRFENLDGSVHRYAWRPDDAALHCALTLKDTTHYSTKVNAGFKKSKYSYESYAPSIHYFEGTGERGYWELSGNTAFYLLSRQYAGTRISEWGNLECIWTADTLGMRVCQYRGMKNVTVYLVDNSEKGQCAVLVVNGGLDTFKAFLNSYTLNGEESVADKYNVIFTLVGHKTQTTKEDVYGKKSGLHLKYPILDEAYSKGLLPYYKRSE